MVHMCLLIRHGCRAVVWIWKRVLWTGGVGCTDRHGVGRLDVHVLLKTGEVEALARLLGGMGRKIGMRGGLEVLVGGGGDEVRGCHVAVTLVQ